MSDPRRTPLSAMHERLGGKMVDFENWYMPVKFEGQSVSDEHLWTREHCGIFDICHMTEFMLEGPDSIPFLKHMMTNSIGIGDNQAQYQHMCYPEGGVIDDLYIYRESAEKFRIIANAQTYETEGKDFNWLTNHIGDYKVTLDDLSLKRARFAVQGKETIQLLNPITSIDLSPIKRFRWTYANLQTTEGDIPIFCSRTGYTGVDNSKTGDEAIASYEISCDTKFAELAYQTFVDMGAKPVGLGARNSLRLECSYALYGNDINQDITSIEAKLGWVVKPKEDAHFIGEDVLLKQKSEGTARISVGLNLLGKGILRDGYKIFAGEDEIGFITSGAYGASVGKSIALALIKKEYSKIGTELVVEIRSKRKNVVVVSTPFWKQE